MATQTKTHTTPDFGIEQWQVLGSRVAETSRKAGLVYLDSYERTLRAAADIEERVAASTSNEWLTSFVAAHADFTRELAKVQTSAARQLLQ
jgi:hypothetical protein